MKLEKSRERRWCHATALLTEDEHAKLLKYAHKKETTVSLLVRALIVKEIGK